MVAEQIEARGIVDPAVLAALRAVPRHRFVPDNMRLLAYDDSPLPIGSGQTISQPYIVALMTAQIRPRRDMRVLEIGTGSGYQAAILVAVGARVTTIERHANLADEARERLAGLGAGQGDVEVRVGDGSRGVPDGAPWDGIVVTAGAPSIADELREQLAVGARLVIPVGDRASQDLRVVERRGPDDWREWSDGAVVFVPLVGEGGWKAD
jgi:protein-L-isoaspartate(D-aspartate) O-methyltransferase